ncbi:MAG: CehA/McbA family metallohydrolase, partial [Armatimonadota bacterium]
MTTDRRSYGRIAATAILILLLTVGLSVAQVEILQPAPDTALSGPVHVVVRTASEEVSGIHARVGDRPWVAMYRADDDTWRARIDTTLAPNGETAIRVQQWPVGDDSAAEVAVTLDNPLRHYWGNIHSHTSVSDGRMRPDEAYAYARDIAQLDFFTLADHLERVEPAEWRETVRAATLTTDDGSFVALTGLEWTKSVGHMCVYEPAGHIWPKELAEFYTFAPGNCAVAKFNHPGWRDTNFEEFAYSAEGDAAIQLIEVRSHAEMLWYIEALNRGWHLAPDGSDDTHRERWGTSGRWTVILAPGLSYHTVMDALASRRTYSTQDRNCRLWFTLNDAVMGEVIEEPVSTAVITVAVDDPDEDDRIELIELFANGEVIRTDRPDSASHRWSLKLTPEPGSHY